MHDQVLSRLAAVLLAFVISLPALADTLVFGGTRGIGLETVRELRDNGKAVTVLVRETSDLTALNEIDGVKTTVGDALDMESVTRAYASGTFESAISTLGGSMEAGFTVDSVGNMNAVDGAKAAGVDRFILVTSVGAGDSRAAAPAQMLKALGQVLVEKEKAERHLIDSGLSWTIIRPGFLNDKPKNTVGMLTQNTSALRYDQSRRSCPVGRRINRQRTNTRHDLFGDQKEIKKWGQKKQSTSKWFPTGSVPWCFVGKRRLEAALAEHPDLNVTAAWQPFQLSPDLPREGRNRQDYYREIFGPERAATIMDRLKQTGEEEGISFGSHADAMAPNTLSAHVLMYWAGADDGIDVNDLAEKLFHAHHVACEDIGDHPVLTRIATEVGMDADDVAARLAAREDETSVKGLIATSTARGVSGVPFFIINGQYAISGAQPTDILLSAFDQIAPGD